MPRLISILLLFVFSLPSSAQSFDAFVADVLATDAAGQQAKVNTFLSSAPSFPFIDNDTTAVFIWTGSASSVAVSGDFTGWSGSGRSMQRLGTTNLWYLASRFESDARIDYKIIQNGSNWILDPRNPNRIGGGFGDNSELAMPDYVQPWEVVADPTVPKGSTVKSTFTSSIMGNSRSVTVYTPHGYDPTRTEAYPVILYHDGRDYLNIAYVPTILDNLIDAGRIEPIIAVFVDPVNREAEYATSSTDAFTRLIVEELMPWAESNYHISTDPSRRAVTGPSYAGLASARHCFEHPQEFQLCGLFSPSFWVGQGALLNEIGDGDSTVNKWYVDWGTYESSIASRGRAFEDILRQQGADFVAKEWHEGHSWGSWRAHQDLMLEFFFPGVNATSRLSLEQPRETMAMSVYPNPSSGDVRLAFETSQTGPIQVDVFDVTGRHIQRVMDTTLPVGKHEASFDTSSLTAGTYLFRVITDDITDGRTFVQTK